MRVELFYRPVYKDGRAERLRSSLEKNFGIKLMFLSLIDVYILEGFSGLSAADLDEVFADHVAQSISLDSPLCTQPELASWNFLVEIAYKPGVTDPVAITARDALLNWRESAVSPDACVRTARQYLFSCQPLSEQEQKKIFGSLYNPLIETALIISKEEWEKGKRTPQVNASQESPDNPEVKDFALFAMNDGELLAFSKEKLLALSLEEMKAIQKHFADTSFIAKRGHYGLEARITDVEIEMIAQTWSEHCKHKIFNATITYTDGAGRERITSVFDTYIKRTTQIVARKKKYLLSVFHDNSGVIRFDKNTALCFKVETHNSPSALDPYGGAITGIVGVNRDVLGTGKLARPIFNTNVLCFADPDTPANEVPEGFLHPRRIMEGVHRGIIDGGNQSGIPTIAGAFLFDPSFIGKPLVFCGTGGILPAYINGEASWIKHINPGDLAVMVGGRIGKDGIHGATFSSLALDEESPTSAVQIGDPITQKKMWDFLEEARDLCLFAGITDNGAGGLSSSLGEMATFSGGVRIELDKCPLKYPGLSPWEILVSESQERMSVAVNKKNIDEFLSLAARRCVEAVVVGEFTNTGFVEVLFARKTCGLIDLEFLHEGLPVLELEATWKPPASYTATPQFPPLEELLYSVLADPNVSSREALVRQYDHEVQGCSVVKPFVGVCGDGHSDGAVYKPCYDSYRGITITHGICPRLGGHDTYTMAANAVDEAFRAHIALGGDPELTAALDNFCWPDPVASPSNPDGAYKLAQLVRASAGLKDTCLAYGIPLISGKDSMKNDAFSGNKKISIKPTLLISLMGIIKDLRFALTTDFKCPGHIIYLLGETKNECGGSILERVMGRPLGACPEVNPTRALSLYRALHRAIRAGLVRSCHDCAEGGLLAAAVESAIGGRYGFSLLLDNLPGEQARDAEDAVLLFAESASRFIVSIDEKDEKKFQKLFRNLPAARLGQVTEEAGLSIRHRGKKILDSSLERALAAWKGTLR